MVWVLAVGVLAVPQLVTVTGPVGPGRVQVGLEPAVWGETRLELGPLGSVTSPTHSSPVRVVGWVGSVETAGLDRYADTGRLEQEISVDLRALAGDVAGAVVLWALVVGGCAGALWPGRGRVRRALAGALVLGVFSAGVLVWTWASFDPVGVPQARFDGPVEQAPGLLADVSRIVDGYGQLTGRLEAVAGRMASLYSALGTEEVVRSDGETVLLHVSDLHLNPVGVELAAELSEAFAVDAVIDTGDLTSLGTVPESGFVAALARVPVPYVLVPGNHDGGVDLAAGPLGVPDNVRVLASTDGEVLDVAGLRIAGFADPTSESRGQSALEQTRLLAAQRAGIDAFLDTEEGIDLVAVHNPLQLTVVRGRAPVGLAGHVHEFALGELAGTDVAVSGSTGAGGIGGLAQGDPYRAQLLRFVDGRLVAVDQIDAEGLDGEFTITRRLTPDEPGGLDGVLDRLRGAYRD